MNEKEELNLLTKLLYQVSETIFDELETIYPNIFTDIVNTLYKTVEDAINQEASSIFHKYTNGDLTLCFELVCFRNGWYLVDYTVGEWKVDDVLDITNCSTNKEEFPSKLLNNEIGKVMVYLDENYIFNKLNKWLDGEFTNR